MNSLYYGDNLVVLRESIKDESVDLIYLDPPFNSSATYNVLFSSPKGHKSEAQIEAFGDTWHWGPQAEEEFTEVLRSPNTDVAEMMQAMRSFLGENDMMAYLTMMGNRLLEMHRVLKPTGSIYLHCDPTASHYLKLLLDAIFSAQCFRNEIIWQRTGAHNDANRWGRVSDTILFYTKGDAWTWNTQYTPYSAEYIDERYRYVDEGSERKHWRNTMTAAGPGPARLFRGKLLDPPDGTHWRFSQEEIDRLDRAERIYYSPSGMPYVKSYLDERKGRPVQNIWTDIVMSKSGAERLGYPTQKPLGLLERIIEASSNPSDVVLDPFCGCGTAVHAAQKLKRDWVGIDITHLAISLIEKRLKNAFPGIKFNVEGTPIDLDGARDLAMRDKYQFQWWACSLVDAQPYQGKRKGADGGIDGLIFFDDEKSKAKKIIVSVKGGNNIGLTMLKDLIATVKGEKAQIGLFVTLTPPTKPMIAEAARAGYYDSPIGKSYPCIQILTIEGLMNKTERPEYPLSASGGVTFKKAKVELRNTKQSGLFESREEP